MNPITVTDLKKVDATRYIEGQVFLAGKKIGILLNGKVEEMVKKSDLKDYVKKKDVEKMIDDTLRKVSQ